MCGDTWFFIIFALAVLFIITHKTSLCLICSICDDMLNLARLQQCMLHPVCYRVRVEGEEAPCWAAPLHWQVLHRDWGWFTAMCSHSARHTAVQGGPCESCIIHLPWSVDSNMAGAACKFILCQFIRLFILDSFNTKFSFSWATKSNFHSDFTLAWRCVQHAAAETKLPKWCQE